MTHVLATSLHKYEDALLYITKLSTNRDIQLTTEVRNLLALTFRQKVFELQASIAVINTYIEHQDCTFVDELNNYKAKVQSEL